MARCVNLRNSGLCWSDMILDSPIVGFLRRSLVCVEAGTGTGFEDMMIDNWTLDGDDEIDLEDDIGSLQYSNETPSKIIPPQQSRLFLNLTHRAMSCSLASLAFISPILFLGMFLNHHHDVLHKISLISKISINCLSICRNT